MPRHAWEPDDKQKKMLATLARLHKKWGDAEIEYKQYLTQCAAEEIPVAKMAAVTNQQRKTVYRHLGRPMT